MGSHLKPYQGQHSGFSSDRINLSPFTKNFREEEQYEYQQIFDAPAEGGAFFTC